MDSSRRGVRESGPVTPPTRLYHVDWLRVIAMFSVFLFHNNRFYDFDLWHIKNAELSLGPAVFVEIFNLWIMPLLFVLSGAAVCYSLGSRTAGVFIKERILRILVPLVGIGMWVLAPLQVYLERLTHGQFSGTVLQFYPHYFDGFYGFGGNFAFMGVHLWYLMLLFLFSLIALPLFLPMTRTGKSIISRLANVLDKPWGLPALFFPLGAAGLVAEVAGLGFTRQMGSWDILSYFVFFIYGYLLFSSRRIQDMVNRYGVAAIIVAAILTVAHLVLKFTVQTTGAVDLRALCAWSWVIGILGMGSRLLNFNNRLLGYANEAVLPFYILHQPTILLIGFFVIPWSMGVLPKYLAISASSFVAIMAIYELLVRRINALRFLFGMKPGNG